MNPESRGANYMRRIAGPHWIKHSHLFDPDEYECSRCGAVFKKK